MTQTGRYFRALCDRYPDADVVERAGVPYPVALFALPDVPIDQLIHRLDGPAVIDEELLAFGAEHVDQLRRSRPGLHDGPVVVLDRVQADGTMTVRDAGYFAMLATCDALSNESMVQPNRRQRVEYLSGPTGPLESGAGRAAAVGLSIVTGSGSGATGWVVVGRRSAQLGTDPGKWHVAPSGMVEPGSLEQTAARELSEELGLRVPASELASRLKPLGLAVDLVRLRPEVCLQLSITAAEAADIRAGSEFADLARVDYTALPDFWARRSPSALTPAAAGALALLERKLS